MRIGAGISVPGVSMVVGSFHCRAGRLRIVSALPFVRYFASGAAPGAAILFLAFLDPEKRQKLKVCENGAGPFSAWGFLPLALLIIAADCPEISGSI